MTKRTPLIDKYQANVVVTDGCWDWTGPINEHGYAILYVPVEDAPQRRWTPSRAHRFAFETFVGPIPEGLTLDHVCHTEAVQRGECAGGSSCPHRRCTRPDHLEPVTQSENTKRGVTTAGRLSTHCKYGHEWTEATTHIATRADRGKVRTYRVCRICTNIRAKKVNEERKALTRARRAQRAA